MSVTRLISVRPSTSNVELTPPNSRLHRQQVERQVEAFDGFLLVRSVLRAQPEYGVNAEIAHFEVVIAKAARLGRAASRAGDVVPASGRRLIGAAGARIAIDDGPARKC